MKLLVCLLAMSMSFCATTKPAKKNRSKAATHKSGTVLVDSDWMAKYKSAEAKYGYRIDQDAEIKSEKGKYRVPQEVVDHNLDMTKAHP